MLLLISPVCSLLILSCSFSYFSDLFDNLLWLGSLLGKLGEIWQKNMAGKSATTMKSLDIDFLRGARKSDELREFVIVQMFVTKG